MKNNFEKNITKNDLIIFLVLSFAFFCFRVFPLAADPKDKQAVLHRFRARPLVQWRLDFLRNKKLKDGYIGAYSAAPVVNPKITDMNQLKAVVKKIKNGTPLSDDEKPYLMGNNHNYQSNLEVIQTLRQNQKSEEIVKNFSTLKCQFMVMPSGFRGGVNFNDINNKVSVIRMVSSFASVYLSK